MRALLFTFLALSLSACIKIDEIPKDSALEPLAPRQPQVQELADPDKYKVLLPVEEGMQMVQRHEVGDMEHLEALPNRIENGVFTDDQPQAGKSYVYDMGVVTDGNFKILKSFEIAIPKDLLIQQEYALQGDESWSAYHRIFLGKNAIVTTNGFHFILQADQLLSNGGLIQTFVPGSEAPAGAYAKPGGTIQIFLRTGKGALRFEMRGQQGGKGADGATPAAEPFTGPIFPIFPNFGNGGPIGVGGRMTSELADLLLKAGTQGGRGGDGLRGGSTGRVDITIQEKHELFFQPNFEPGQGGAWGTGGAGQPVGGSVDAAGTQGEHGGQGSTGIKEDFCVFDFRKEPCK